MRKSCSGFTVVELLIILSLIALLFTLGVAQYNRFNRSQSLNRAKDELISNLRLAQGKAMAGEKPDACTEALSGHKLKFTDNQNYKIVAVCGEEIEVKAIALPDGVEKKSGTAEIFFRVLNQGIESDVSLTLADFDEEKTITVNTAGEIK